MIKKALEFFGIVAIVAMIGFTFAGCYGPEGPQGYRGDQGSQGGQGSPGGQGPAPELVVDIGDDSELTVILGVPNTLIPNVYPYDALVQTLLWELYDPAYGDIIRLSRVPASRFPMLSGHSIVVTGIADGEARILVTALGAGGELVQKTITVTVEGIATRIAELRELHSDGDLPETATLTAHGTNGLERIVPQVLYFDGEEIEITLRGAGSDSDLSLAGLGAMFTIGEGVTLILEDITLRGMANNSNALVVNNNGTLRMRAGSRITGNSSTATLAASQGGGVRNGGVFIMEGGEITGNTLTTTSGLGGGVFNSGAGAIFTMYDGRISGNTASRGGGVYANTGTTFTMHDGEISGNMRFVSVLAAHGGGGVMTRGAFTMHAGKISGNEANIGGGVRVDAAGTFDMRGGIISGNTAVQSAHGGGGVANVANGRFRMHGGTITGNEANVGGGVINIGLGAFTMRGGVISGNTAAQGGGVNNNGANAVFTIGGGVIHGSNAGSALRNTAAGAAVLTVGAAQSRVSNLDADHEVVGDVGALPANISITVEVENGNLINRGDAESITITGIPARYIGDEVDFLVFSGAGWVLLGHAEITGDTASFAGMASGIWDIRLDFWSWSAEVSDWVLQSRYFAMDRTITTGTNAMPLADFDVQGAAAAFGGNVAPLGRTLPSERLALPEDLDAPSFMRVFE